MEFNSPITARCTLCQWGAEFSSPDLAAAAIRAHMTDQHEQAHTITARCTLCPWRAGSFSSPELASAAFQAHTAEQHERAEAMTVQQLARRAGLAEAVNLAHVFVGEPNPLTDIVNMAETFARYIETGERP